jgi:hypothetical protein
MPTIAAELDETTVQTPQARQEDAAQRRASSFGDTLLAVALVLYPALAAVGAIAAGLMFSA